MKLQVVQRADRPVPWRWLAFSLLAPIMFAIPIGHDAIWQMWIGRELWHGAEFGKDVIEVNPPLWFWIAAPIAGLGELLGIAPRYLVVSLMVTAMGLSLYLIPNRYRPPALAAFALLALVDFGQREHFALISSAPYAFLIAQRARAAQPKHPLMIGFFAALGFALKPYFVIVPVALELLAWRAPRFRPETLALIGSAILYTASVLIFAPAYVTDVIPMVRAYYPYFQSNLGYWTFDAALLFGVVGAAAGLRKGSAESRVLALSALAFLPAVILQAKGWSYQTIPVRGFLFLAVVAELMRERKNPFADATLVGAALLTFCPVGLYSNSRAPYTNEHLKSLNPGTTITALTTNPSMVWPMIEDHHLQWTSRQFCLWQASAANENKDYLPALRRIVAQELAQKPHIILVDRRPFIARTITEAIPPGALSGYRLRRRTSGFLDSYERIATTAAPPGVSVRN